MGVGWGDMEEVPRGEKLFFRSVIERLQSAKLAEDIKGVNVHESKDACPPLSEEKQ